MHDICQPIILHALPRHVLPRFSMTPLDADSVMGVALFREESPTCFGSFYRALTSMFRLTAGETWLDELVAFNPDDGGINLTTVLFVDSYIVIAVWILLQVSVAVLLVWT